jgi:diguanylate cyclase (GGDEF)-like protein/PAS domain S-box-containing protein
MQFSDFMNRTHLFWASVGLAALFWLGDSLLDGLFFEGTGYFDELMPDDPKELWMRAIVVTGVVLFGYVVQMLINQRDRDQRRLRLSGTVFKTASDAIMVTDADNRIIDLNPAFERITGYSRDMVLGRNPRILKSGKHDAAFYASLWEQLLATGYWEGEVWDRRRNGEIYPKWMNITTIRTHGRVSNFIATFRDISASKEAEMELETLAHYDSLTGLANRSLLTARLEQAVHLARRNNWQLGLIFIDLDHFKEINDSLGHSAGDRLLTEVAKRLRDQLRESDTVARLGGDEFVILLERLSGTSAIAELLAKIKAVLAAAFTLDSYGLYVTASMGISIYPDDGEDAEMLLRNADSAMYHAKKEGRDGWSFYSNEMNLQTRRRLQLTGGLHHAVENNEFTLFYQPQIELVTERISGIEALLRWQHPEFGEVSPEEFIPLAEDTGVVEQIGEWVLTEACRQFRSWRDEGLSLPKVTVNVSARQFKSGRLVDTVESILKNVGMKPHCLGLEIRESLLVKSDVRLLNDMQRLCDLGVGFSLDDFGTGYSSLSYLKRFPVSNLTADHSFVRDIPDDKDDMAITAAIISMAHNLNMRVIAEGVETKEQLVFLQEKGCDEVQGYLISRPLPAADIELFLREWKLSSLIGESD